MAGGVCGATHHNHLRLVSLQNCRCACTLWCFCCCMLYNHHDIVLHVRMGWHGQYVSPMLCLLYGHIKLCCRVVCSFMFEMSVAQPAWLDVGRGFVPTAELFTNPGMLYIAIGKLGSVLPWCASTGHMYICCGSPAFICTAVVCTGVVRGGMLSIPPCVRHRSARSARQQYYW